MLGSDFVSFPLLGNRAVAGQLQSYRLQRDRGGRDAVDNLHANEYLGIVRNCGCAVMKQCGDLLADHHISVSTNTLAIILPARQRSGIIAGNLGGKGLAGHADGIAQKTDFTARQLDGDEHAGHCQRSLNLTVTRQSVLLYATVRARLLDDSMANVCWNAEDIRLKLFQDLFGPVRVPALPTLGHFKRSSSDSMSDRAFDPKRSPLQLEVLLLEHTLLLRDRVHSDLCR